MNTDEFFQALASPYRREILLLLKRSDLSAGEIAAHFNVSQPSISRHLDVLRHAELITSTRLANRIIYSLNRPAVLHGAEITDEILK